jgi:hypothetical protein
VEEVRRDVEMQLKHWTHVLENHKEVEADPELRARLEALMQDLRAGITRAR